jgi:hypothetical protein
MSAAYGNTGGSAALQFQGMIAEYERAQILERSCRGKSHRVVAECYQRPLCPGPTGPTKSNMTITCGLYSRNAYDWTEQLAAIAAAPEVNTRAGVSQLERMMIPERLSDSPSGRSNEGGAYRHCRGDVTRSDLNHR